MMVRFACAATEPHVPTAPPREETASMARQTKHHAACNAGDGGCVEAGIQTLFRGCWQKTAARILKEGEDTLTAPKV